MRQEDLERLAALHGTPLPDMTIPQLLEYIALLAEYTSECGQARRMTWRRSIARS